MRDAAIQTQQQLGVGSGVVVNAETIRLRHGSNACSIRVIFADGSEAVAAIVAYQLTTTLPCCCRMNCRRPALATLGNPGALSATEQPWATC